MFETNLHQILQTIGQFQQKLQNYRQLLNQQIQFNIKDLYIHISGNSSQITAYHLHVFICQLVTQSEEQQIVDIGLLESMIKSYNHCTSMNLSFIEFALIFLSRENRLLAKLTIQRNSLGQIPVYLFNYAKKILQLESVLHRKLIEFRKINSILAQKWIYQNKFVEEVSGEQCFNEESINKICKDIQIDDGPIIRFLKVNDKQQIKLDKMLSLFTLKNCTKLSQFLKKVQKSKNSNTYFKKSIDPYIRPQFHDCLQRPKTVQNFSQRQIKSIEKHFDRLNGQTKDQLTTKINNYRTFIEKQLVLVCEAINNMIKLENQIESQRIQLSLCTDFYPVLFFQSLHRDRKTLLIPSSFQNYLQKLGIKIQLNQLYTIFKRYSTRADGKLNFNQFCSIFDVCHTQYSFIQKNRLVRSLEDVDVETIKYFLKLIKILVKNQVKIQKIKAKLQTQVNLRQIFSMFDEDEDGYVSMTDFKVVWKKYLLMNIKEQQLALLWHRMRMPLNNNNMIKYQKFIYEMTPKLPWIQKQQKKTRVIKTNQ